MTQFFFFLYSPATAWLHDCSSPLKELQPKALGLEGLLSKEREVHSLQVAAIRSAEISAGSSHPSRLICMLTKAPPLASGACCCCHQGRQVDLAGSLVEHGHPPGLSGLWARPQVCLRGPSGTPCGTAATKLISAFRSMSADESDMLEFSFIYFIIRRCAY